jgi:hypothetical protein
MACGQAGTAGPTLVPAVLTSPSTAALSTANRPPPTPGGDEPAAPALRPLIGRPTADAGSEGSSPAHITAVCVIWARKFWAEPAPIVPADRPRPSTKPERGSEGVSPVLTSPPPLGPARRGGNANDGAKVTSWGRMVNAELPWR